MRWCCLTSVAYIGLKSRTERPRKTKIGTKQRLHTSHVTRTPHLRPSVTISLDLVLKIFIKILVKGNSYYLDNAFLMAEPISQVSTLFEDGAWCATVWFDKETSTNVPDTKLPPFSTLACDASLSPTVNRRPTSASGPTELSLSSFPASSEISDVTREWFDHGFDGVAAISYGSTEPEYIHYKNIHSDRKKWGLLTPCTPSLRILRCARMYLKWDFSGAGEQFWPGVRPVASKDSHRLGDSDNRTQVRRVEAQRLNHILMPLSHSGFYLKSAPPPRTIEEWTYLLTYLLT